jgi:hypothetical protein
LRGIQTVRCEFDAAVIFDRASGHYTTGAHRKVLVPPFGMSGGSLLADAEFIASFDNS